MRAGSLREFIDRYETKHGVKPDNRKMMAFYDAHPDIFEAETGSSVAEANKRIKGGKR